MPDREDVERLLLFRLGCSMGEGGDRLRVALQLPDMSNGDAAGEIEDDVVDLRGGFGISIGFVGVVEVRDPPGVNSFRRGGCKISRSIRSSNLFHASSSSRKADSGSAFTRGRPSCDGPLSPRTPTASLI